MGMAPLALYLRGAGVRVEAFDHKFREPLRTELENAGVKILHEPEAILTPDCVVRSSAIPADDPMVSRVGKCRCSCLQKGRIFVFSILP